MNLYKDLNVAQKESVCCGNGAVLVIAGAGSGKTRVLTSRIVHLINEGISPYKILAVTFTNKAAAEMKNRIATYLGEDLVKNLWIGTFHGICGRILRYELQHLKSTAGKNYTNNFVIYDESDSVSVIKAILKKFNLDEKAYSPKTVKNKISQAKNLLISPDNMLQEAQNFIEKNIAEIYKQYEESLFANNALDFDDLLLKLVNLFQDNEDIREKYHCKFQHVLVDEFQDTNVSQYELIKVITLGNNLKADWANRSLVVVGDVDQSIYSWRGADYKIILGFQKDFPEATVIKLEENYRSTETILKVANSIITNNQERLEKNLYTNKGVGHHVLCYEAENERDEGQHIATQIKKYVDGKYSYGDCAVLYRTNIQSRAIEESLIRHNIPYIIIGGTRFYERKEVKDILAYLKLAYNIQDSQSLLRIINVPSRQLGKTSLDHVLEFSVNNKCSLFEAMQMAEQIHSLQNRAKVSFTSFSNLMMSLHEAAQVKSPSELLQDIINQTSYLDYLREEKEKNEDEDAAEDRIANTLELITVAREFEYAAPESSLGDFITQMALLSDLDKMKRSENVVKLLTIHLAKGLEFPVIFLAGLEEGLFPHFRSLNDPVQMEEERRLMYVAVTRAEELLHISYASTRMMSNHFGGTIMSRFIKEIPAQYIQGSIAQSIKREESPYKAFGYSGNGPRKLTQSFKSNTNPAEKDYSVTFGKDFKPPNLKKP